MKIYRSLLAACFIFNVAALAAPKQVFIGAGQFICNEPLRFWSGDAAAIEVLSNRMLLEPEVHLLSKALTAPLELDDTSYHPCGLEEGLYSHTFSFKVPQAREQQRYLLKFAPDGTNLLFAVYPDWLREQVARKAAHYEIMIDPKHSGAVKFFAPFESEPTDPVKRPILKIVHSEHELLLQKSLSKIIWKTNCDNLDADDPSHALRFEALLDTLKTSNSK